MPVYRLVRENSFDDEYVLKIRKDEIRKVEPKKSTHRTRKAIPSCDLFGLSREKVSETVINSNNKLTSASLVYPIGLNHYCDDDSFLAGKQVVSTIRLD